MSIETSLMIISITQLFLAIAIVFVSLTQRDIRMFIRRLSAGVQDLVGLQIKNNSRGSGDIIGSSTTSIENDAVPKHEAPRISDIRAPV